jgi:hypothetical protein
VGVLPLTLCLLQAPAQPPPRRAVVVRVDADWLASRAPGPYVLGQPWATYRLEADVVTDGTAFVVCANDVVLDLNGHRVTYGQASAPEVVNGGFEQGAGRDVPGWDLSGATAACLAPNTTRLFGKQVLRVGPLTTPQRIVSQPVALPRAGHGYVATITPGGRPDWRTGVDLVVTDAASGRELGRARSPNAERGFSAVARFFPTAAKAVRLEVVVTPPPGGTPVTVDLDYAKVLLADDYGVMATSSWRGEVPGAQNLPAALQSAYRRAARVVVKNGRVEQGSAGGYASHPLFAQQVPGLVVDNVRTFACGMDTVSLEASRAPGGVVVRGCTFREQIDNVSNRMHGCATLRLDKVKGTVLVEGCKILGSPQVGVQLGFNDPRHRVVVRNNEIRHHAVVTNGYAVAVAGLHNFTIEGNTVVTESGRGILIDSYSAEPITGGVVRGNRVEVQEHTDREYLTHVEARALRLRNLANARGVQRHLLIEDNTFVARTEPGLAHEAMAARVSYVNPGGEMNDADVVLRHNVFRAVVTTPDPAYRAYALVLDGIDPGINLAIENNVLESNDVSLALAQADGGDVADVQLSANTLRRCGGARGRPYAGVLAGYWTREVRDVRLVGTRYEGGATGDVTWSGTGAKSVGVGDFWSVAVTDARGDPVGGADVVVEDREGRRVFEGTTDAHGRVTRVPVVTAVWQCAAGAAGPARADGRGPFRVRAALGARSAERTAGAGGAHDATLVLR